MYNLFDHQKTAVSRISKLRRDGMGAILADEMGLGKTISMIETLRVNVFSHVNDDGRVLVVVPLSLVPQWFEELNKYLQVKVKIYHGHGRVLQGDSRVVVTTYDVVSREYKSKGIDSSLHKVEWDTVILDEAHYIRNLVSSKKIKQTIDKNFHKAGKGVITLKKKFGYAMTGTPWCNDITDIYSLLDFIKECRSKTQSEDTDWIIRRTKNETLSLPTCTEEVSFVSATAEMKYLRKKYLLQGHESIADYYHGDMRERAKASMNIITCALRIRQLSDSPFMIPDVQLTSSHGASSIMRRSPKIKKTRELVLSQLQKGQKTVIFSKFVKCIELLAIALEPLCDTQMFVGSMSKTNRDNVVNRFRNDPTCNVLLISIDCGGVGLNLTCATMAIIMEPWYNPFAELQAQNRIDRIGQTCETKIIRIVDNSEKSADTWIRGIQQKKTEQASVLIRGLEGMTSSYKSGGDFTMKDFISLFRNVKEYETEPVSNEWVKVDENEDILTLEELSFSETTPRVRSEWEVNKDDSDDYSSDDDIPISQLYGMVK